MVFCLTFTIGGLLLFRVISSNGQLYKNSNRPPGPLLYRNASDYQGYPDHRQRKPCGLPNVLPPYPIIPELQNNVPHYGYLVLQQSAILTNPVAIYQPDGNYRTLFPGTGEPAEVQASVLYSYADSKPETQCQAQYGPYYQSVDGPYFGLYYDSNLGNNIVPDMGSYLYDDYDTVAIYASCYEVNRQTGICTNPGIFVNTQVRPDEMTDWDRRKVNRIVDSVVSQYCFSIYQFYEHEWTKNKPVCSTPGPPGCYTGAINGIANNINNMQFVSKSSSY